MSVPDADPDREAILARRKHFVARALTDLGGPSGALAGRRTKLVALAVTGLTTACPCLKMASSNQPPPPSKSNEEGHDAPESGDGEPASDESDGGSEAGASAEPE
jgi:hypothetical protein